MPRAVVSVDRMVQSMRSSERWHEIRRIINDNPNGGLLLDYFYKMVGELRRENASEEQATKKLAKIKERQSQLGQELSMLNIERIAIMAYLDSRKS